jgi:2-polyprenyl-6-methoxyphenol hydroxylase-like FAD-dependent oxidoreductase
MSAGQRTSAVIAMLRLPNMRRQAYGPGWALVGDAGYHRDPITGYGLSDAYRDAELLATALDQVLRGERGENGALAGYQRCRDAASQEIFDLTCVLAEYPAVPEFIELQKELGHAIDRDAAALAARPIPSERELART